MDFTDKQGIMQPPCCASQRMHRTHGGRSQVRALSHPCVVSESRWSARQTLARPAHRHAAARRRCSVVSSATEVTEGGSTAPPASPPGPAPADSKEVLQPGPARSDAAQRDASREPGPCRHPPAQAGKETAAQVGKETPAQAGKEISRTEIPAFIPRPDLLEQLVREQLRASWHHDHVHLPVQFGGSPGGGERLVLRADRCRCQRRSWLARWSVSPALGAVPSCWC